MKRLKLAEHLTVEELEQRYRQATDPAARSHFQIVWLLRQGRPTAEVVDVTGYSSTWIYALVRRYNRDGPAALGDRRHHNPGKSALLSPALRAELDQALAGSAPDGGLWTGPKVARWMSDKLGRKVRAVRGWELLQQLGYRSYVPRPRHAKADRDAQETFKKEYMRIVPTILNDPS
ncbi:MAG TPA: winged helix-turn-helix domain-containing protein [Roseiflexaceae bacterium]|nr:winged helix-turn-helix domain-containing protein [Roseiflexaceae bacterium]